MIELRCQPVGSAPSEIRIGAGVASDLAGEAEGRRTFALLDAAIRGWAGLPSNWPIHVALPGEEQKTLRACEALLRAMVGAGLDRRSLFVAIGGGAVGDAGGFCASVFLRGIELWQVPTTLLAMVDSSVGGKTAVNLPEGKNLVGTVYPASRILIDLDFLAGLPEPVFRSGLAEAIKMGIGHDAALFELLEREREHIASRDPGVLCKVVERSLRAKIAIVEGDLHEHGDRQLLNLGHTLGHAIEAHHEGRVPHGLCVARGLHFALALARDRGDLSPTDARRCRALLTSYGFADDPLPPGPALMPFVARDKKVRDGEVQFALPTGIGVSRVEPIALEAIATRLPNS